MAKRVKAKYTNGFSLSTTIGETRLLFTLSSPVLSGENEGGASTEDVADMRMNIVLAKQLLVALNESIGNYEKAFGEVVIPQKEQIDG